MDEFTKNKLNILVISLTQGNISALDEIYEIMGKIMFSIAYTILWNKEDAEDILSEVFITIVKKANKFTRKNNAYAWINTITKNLAKNKLKKKKRLKEVSIDCANNIQNAMDDSNLIIKEVFNLLNTYEQDLLVYKYWYGLSFAEIGETCNKSKQTIVSQINRIEEKIKKLYNFQ